MTGILLSFLFVPGVLPADTIETELRRTDTLLVRPDLNAYRGWLKFLRYEAVTTRERLGPEHEQATEKLERWREWLDRITKHPDTLRTLTGVQEWAYESPVDGSGQPFKLAIPTDYDPARPAPLAVQMHGYSGNHLEHSTGMAARPEWFEVAVLGRSRGGGYRALSEADVLHVVDYIERHWSIDPDRIHLGGGSMGGFGTMRLASRYPHRWASARPVCGYGGSIPPGNLLTVPLYATHSVDDYVVPVLLSRGLLQQVRARGGVVVQDETNGLGHAAWDYSEGNARGDAWARAHRRPASKEVRRIDFTAVDGGAVRAWWAELVEWGPETRPARFALTAGARALQVELDNVTRLRVDLQESPFPAEQELTVIVNGKPPLRLPAPLPPVMEVSAAEAGSWQLTAGASPSASPRLRTPGFASLLYNGEPLLIVYGSGGDAVANAAMRSAAVAASRGPNPGWLPDGPAAGERGSDGVPHSHNLYGSLPIKADHEVTPDDLARCHLVLIGTAEENACVARLASQLPVQWTKENIVCSDGTAFGRAGRMSGLVHYNPLAPSRLVFWVASDRAASYGPHCLLPALATTAALDGSVASPDLVIMDALAPTVVATRTFDSRWRWDARRASSPLLPADWVQHGTFAEALGEALRTAAGTAFALVQPLGPAKEAAYTPGETRLADLLPLFHYAPIGRLELTGAELARLAGQLPALPELRLVPTPDAGALDPAGSYSVALPVGAIWSLVRGTQLVTPYQQLELSMQEVAGRHLLAAPPVPPSPPSL